MSDTVKKEFKPKPGILYKAQYDDRKSGEKKVKLNITLNLDVLGFPPVPGETKNNRGERVFRLTALPNDFKKPGETHAPDYNLRLTTSQAGKSNGASAAASTPEYPI